jgi:iron complex transport system ATP-binding protein
MLETMHLAVDRGARRVLSGVSLLFSPGRLAVIAGPNGAGKSTLIKALSGELSAAQGAVYLDGEALHRTPAAALAARRAVVPQATSLSFPFTVLEVVRLGSSVPGFGHDRHDEHAQAALAAIDLPHFAQRLYTQLSGGERQRVHFARALCHWLYGAIARRANLQLGRGPPNAAIGPGEARSPLWADCHCRAA